MLLRRCFAVAALCLTLAAPLHAQSVPLLNGSNLSLAGLNLVVSNCSLVLAGSQQSSCASGNLVLQTATSSRGTVAYRLAWYGSNRDGEDNNQNGENNNQDGQNNNQDGQNNKYQVSFTLNVTTGSTLSAATLTTPSTQGADLNTHQVFSAAVGGGSLTVDSQASQSATRILAKATAFVIIETVALNITDMNQFREGFDPDAPKLNLVTQTFTAAPEPAAIAILLSGLSGIAVVRRRGSPRKAVAA